MEIGAEAAEGDATEPFEQQSLGVLEGRAEGRVDGLLDDAGRRIAAVPHGEDPGRAEGDVDVTQRHVVEVAGQRPSPSVTLLGCHEAEVAQATHQTAHHDGVRTHDCSQPFGRHRSLELSHVEKDVKHARQTTVASHATVHVA